jgi:hypothetical protein
MRIAKPLLLVSTPIGVGWALVEAARVHWWLAALMAGLVAVPGLGAWLVMRAIRRERARAPARSPRDRDP